MEETKKSPNDNGGNKKIIIKAGGGGGIGAVFLLGGALVAVALASAFSVRRKRRSSGDGEESSPEIDEKRDEIMSGGEEVELENDSAVLTSDESLKLEDEAENDAVSEQGFVIIEEEFPLSAVQSDDQLKEDQNVVAEIESDDCCGVGVIDDTSNGEEAEVKEMKQREEDSHDQENNGVEEVRIEKMEEFEEFCNGNGEINEDKCVEKTILPLFEGHANQQDMIRVDEDEVNNFEERVVQHKQFYRSDVVQIDKTEVNGDKFSRNQGENGPVAHLLESMLPVTEVLDGTNEQVQEEKIIEHEQFYQSDGGQIDKTKAEDKFSSENGGKNGTLTHLALESMLPATGELDEANEQVQEEKIIEHKQIYQSNGGQIDKTEAGGDKFSFGYGGENGHMSHLLLESKLPVMGELQEANEQVEEEKIIEHKQFYQYDRDIDKMEERGDKFSSSENSGENDIVANLLQENMLKGELDRTHEQVKEEKIIEQEQCYQSGGVHIDKTQVRDDKFSSCGNREEKTLTPHSSLENSLPVTGGLKVEEKVIEHNKFYQPDPNQIDKTKVREDKFSSENRGEKTLVANPSQGDMLPMMGGLDGAIARGQVDGDKVDNVEKETVKHEPSKNPIQFDAKKNIKNEDDLNWEALWQEESRKEASMATQTVKLMKYEVGGKVQEDRVHGNGMIKKNEGPDLITRRVMIWMISLLTSLSCSWFFDLSFTKLSLLVFLTLFLSEIYCYSMPNRRLDFVAKKKARE